MGGTCPADLGGIKSNFMSGGHEGDTFRRAEIFERHTHFCPKGGHVGHQIESRVRRTWGRTTSSKLTPPPASGDPPPLGGSPRDTGGRKIGLHFVSVRGGKEFYFFDN